VRRDVNALEELKLIVRDAGTIRAKEEVMLAFLSPIRRSKGPQAAKRD